MHHFTRFIYFLALGAITMPVATAQITVTEADFTAVYTLGANLTQTSNLDSDSYDIGSEGGGNVWNFASATFTDTVTFDIQTPGDTPSGSSFPAANRAFTFTVREFVEDINDTLDAQVASYLAIDANQLALVGSILESEVMGISGQFITLYDPPAVQFPFPMTLGTTASSSGDLTSTSTIAGVPIETTEETYEVSLEADAFGTIQFPDGSTEDGLRMIAVEESVDDNMDTTLSITYTFLAKSGKFLVLDSDDETVVTSGSVPGTLTFLTAGTVSNTLDRALRAGAQIDWLGPNPVNTRAELAFQLDQGGIVTIALFDASGKQLQTVLNQRLQAGNHQLPFSMAGWPSGVYQLVLETENGRISRPIVKQ